MQKQQKGQLKVTLVKSTISSLEKHKKTVEALGLKKVGSCNVLPDNNAVQGMLYVVRHLVKVEKA